MFQPVRYLDPPSCDLLSWTFENLGSYSQHKDIYIDAHDDSNRLTASQAISCVRKLISGFQARGLKPGDCVCVHSFNNIWYSVVYLAIIGAGGRFAASNPSYKNLEVRNAFVLSKAKFIVVEPGLLHNTLPAAKECGIDASNIFTFNMNGDSTCQGFEPLGTLLHYGERDWVTFNDERQSKYTIAVILFTSGTTGLPKAAGLSHFALVSTCLSSLELAITPFEITRLLCLPQSHSFTAPVSHISPLRYGQTTYIMRRFHLQSFVQYIQRYQITETAAVPPMIADMLASPLVNSASLSSLRIVLCAGCPLDKSTQQKMMAVLAPEARILQVYGMTESGWITTFSYPERDTSGSVGRQIPNMEIKLVDEYGEEITGDSHPGELLVRGPSTMTGYLGDSESTKDAMVKGWLKTGDVGCCRGGKWYITDRVKDIIKVRGWQVAPFEIETCLLSHPSIEDAAVIGVKLPNFIGEVPRAYVVIQQTAPRTLTETHIVEYLGDRLAKYKALAGGCKIVDSIPKNPTGKILRRVLKERAMHEIMMESSSEESLR